MDFDRRLSEHMASDEAALLGLREESKQQSATLKRIETNHLAHMEPDIRDLKATTGRIEKALEAMASDLKRNSTDTQQTNIDMANLRGELNTKIATLEVRESAGKGGTAKMMDWIWDLLKIMLAASISAAVVSFGK